MWAFSNKFGIIFVGIAVNALIARLLSPKEVGAYFLVFSLVAAGAMVSQIGLRSAAVRSIAQSTSTNDFGRARAAIHAVLLLGALGALCISLILYMGGGKWIAEGVFGSKLISGVLLVVPIWIIFTSAQGILAEVFRGLHDVRLATFFNEFFQRIILLILLAAAWFIFNKVNFNHVVSIATLSAGVSWITAAWFLRAKVDMLNKSSRDVRLGPVIKHVMDIAFPMFFTSISLFLLTQTDVWIIGIYRPEEELALYGAASRLVGTISIPFDIVNAILPPFIVELYTLGKNQELERLLQSTATIASIPALFLILAFVIFGKTILEFVYGVYYMGGYVVLLFLSLGKFMSVLTGSCGLLLNLTGRHGSVMMFSIGAMLFAILSSRFVIGSHGIEGVAACFCAAFILLNIAMAFYALKSMRIKSYITFRLDLAGMIRKVKHADHL